MSFRFLLHFGSVFLATSAVGLLPNGHWNGVCFGDDAKIPVKARYSTKRPTEKQIAEYNLDSAYFKKCTLVEDILIATSERVSDLAHWEAAYQFEKIMQTIRSEIAQRIREKRVLCILIGHDELTSDIPQFRDRQKGKELDFYNWRQRGFLTRKSGRPTVVFAEEDVLEYEGGMQKESILIHEFGHVIHGAGFDDVLQERLTPTFKRSHDLSLWMDGGRPKDFAV